MKEYIDATLSDWLYQPHIQELIGFTNLVGTQS